MGCLVLPFALDEVEVDFAFSFLLPLPFFDEMVVARDVLALLALLEFPASLAPRFLFLLADLVGRGGLGSSR